MQVLLSAGKVEVLSIVKGLLQRKDQDPGQGETGHFAGLQREDAVQSHEGRTLLSPFFSSLQEFNQTKN